MLNYPALRILSEGVDMAIRHNAPPDVTARLRGAYHYAEATGHVLRDEMLARKTPSPVWNPVIPPPNAEAVQDA